MVRFHLNLEFNFRRHAVDTITFTIIFSVYILMAHSSTSLFVSDVDNTFIGLRLALTVFSQRQNIISVSRLVGVKLCEYCSHKRT